MRPLAVTMVGFGTFADAVTVDFDGADVFALVGPTGSGKSTVIDAICFALYGTIPRYDDRRAVGAAVHTLAAEARVSLTFELAGTRYVAVRVVRRDKHGKASTKEARLERADGEVLAGTTKEMETVVPELLGLGFDQFTRAVVLPQGDFARFLHDKPAARQDLLVQLLGLDVYERMMQRARAGAAETSASRDRDRERIAALVAATPEARVVLAARAAACANARDEWRAMKPEFDAISAEASATEAVAASAHDRVARLTTIEIPRDVAELAIAVRQSDGALAIAEAEAEAAAEAVLVADAAVAEGGDRARLVAARDAHALFEKLRAEMEPLGAARARAAVDAFAAAEAASAAETHTEARRTANASHVVREHLVVGEPCPVCEQMVAAIPKGETPSAWRDAREASVAARERAEAAAKVLARAEHRVEELNTAMAAASVAIVDAPSVDHIDAELVRLDTLARAAATGREQDQEARRKVRRAREARDAAVRGAQHARDAYRARRDELSGAGLVPPPESDDIAADWTHLAAWAVAETVRHREVAEVAMTLVVATRAEAQSRLGALATTATSLALEIDPQAVTLDDLVAVAGAEVRVIEERISRLDVEIAERTALEAAVAATAGDAEVASELARLLDASHFERWLVSEALTRLVDGGSARFHDLSDGRYSFAFDETGRDLLVVDHTQGDERRSVRTLSGGETFQASLALALALSDQLADLAADGAARLESIFLDEGFGTLDAETLDTVAGTIENLGADDRMVGIVTHVPELAARMPVQYRVTKGSRSSHVERVVT